MGQSEQVVGCLLGVFGGLVEEGKRRSEDLIVELDEAAISA